MRTQQQESEREDQEGGALEDQRPQCQGEGELRGVVAAEGSSLVRTEDWPLDLATWRSTVTPAHANW